MLKVGDKVQNTEVETIKGTVTRIDDTWIYIVDEDYTGWERPNGLDYDWHDYPDHWVLIHPPTEEDPNPCLCDVKALASVGHAPTCYWYKRSKRLRDPWKRIV